MRASFSPKGWLVGGVLWAFMAAGQSLAGVEPEPPRAAVTAAPHSVTVSVTPYPGAERYGLLRADRVEDRFVPFADDALTGYSWNLPGEEGQAQAIYRVVTTPMTEEGLLSSIVLNRLAYGPTPDELTRLLTGSQPLGARGYITEQLHPEQLEETLDRPMTNPEWQLVSLTGVATSSVLYLYLDTPGDVYVDDLALVAGTVAEQGKNLLTNGGFELPLDSGWTVSTNLSLTAVSAEAHHSGQSSLHLIATSGGSTKDSALWRTVTPSLVSGQVYTVSYWFLPSTNGNNLTLRLSGSGNRLDGIDTTRSLVPSEFQAGVLAEKLKAHGAKIDDLRAWFILHAVRAKRQLLEVMTQFSDNHFTTQYSKTRDYIGGLITNQTTIARVATDLEFREISRWREVLLDPNGTFLDLLKVSAESPAMVVYLDTVASSSGNANENYSRELLELFTMGVDNGYDQTDIEQMARAWTGWRVDKLPLGQENNPFSVTVTNRETDPGTWSLRFRADRHDTKAKTIFKGKTVGARFGAPWAGRSYELVLPARTGQEGMKDGYEVISHLANLPYTEEYLSVRLCRLLVHDFFGHGSYDYTQPDTLSAEGRLVLACMQAWEAPGPDGRQGNLRQVLATIFNSELFSHQAASQQKVKTPLEFVASTIRSLRAARTGGGYTADTDGYDAITTLKRLNMAVFDRAEPDGWSEAGRDWVSTASLIERMRFAQGFLVASRNPLKRVDFGVTGDNNVSDPVALIRMRLPEGSWRDPAAVADLFLGLFFPGEGRGNLALDRAQAIGFLDANDAGASSAFASLDPSGLAYDARVRSAVAMLLCLPRFQEQ